jgi:arylsulfatase A-like enzyme
MGATIGLAVGVFEAGLLYFTPWIPTLFEPDVSYVIWFLSPLVNLCLFGLLGLVLGRLAAHGKSPGPRRSVILAAAMLGVAGAYVAWSIDLVHVRVGDFRAVKDLTTPSIWLAIVFACTLIAARVWWQRASHLFESERPWPLGLMARGLMAAMLVLLSGLGFHFAKRSDLLSPERESLARSKGRPNIVLISLDTVRADHLSAYGYHRLTSPNISRLAGQGVLFENAVAPSSWTLTTHASIFTGLLPHQHQGSNYKAMNSAPRTLAEIVKSQGYETAAFNANNAYGQGGWGLSQGFEVYEDSRSLLRHNLARTIVDRALVRPFLHHMVRPGINNSRRDARELNHEVRRWFRNRSDRPYFLFVNYFDAHGLYFAPPPHDKRFGQLSVDVAKRISFAEGFPLRPPLNAEEQESLVAGYDNCLAFLDEQVGELVKFLAQSPDWSNTIVIITADHGESFGSHGMYLHGRNLYYREALHVPLVITGAGIPPGLRIPYLVRLRDVFPTVLDLALGNELPFGRASLRRFWTPGHAHEPSDEWVVSQVIPFLPDFRPVMISLMASEWHYIHDSKGRAELYHWQTDPHEKNDVAKSPEHQETLKSMQQRLHELTRHSLRPWRAPEYLFALDAPGYSFLREIVFGEPIQVDSPPRQSPMGSHQAFFSPDPSSTPKPAHPEDAELLESLPYR